jgi:hypothetical protein
MFHRPYQLSRLIALATLVAGVAAWAGEVPAAKAKPAPAGADLQKLVQQLGQQRDSMIADHEALAKQLKDASDTQRKAILEKMAEQKKAFEEATAALHRQIRDEQRRQRQNAAPGKR